MMWDGYGMGFGGLWMVLWWALVAVGLVALVRWFATGRPGRSMRPIDILKARYARGEIGREEYERLKRELAEP